MSKFRAGIRRKPKNNSVQPLSFKKGNNVCNICRNKENLTDDHVPPRCCGNDKEIVARRVYADELIARQVDARSRNGLKFRTICKPCNGDLLGSWDGALGAFAEQARLLLAENLVKPARVHLRIRAGAVLRSVLGHMLSVKVQDDDIPVDGKIRDYLLGRAPLDPSIVVYCWLYPFGPTVISRDFTFVEVVGKGGKSPGIVSVIKFFPLAFCILDARGPHGPGGAVTPLHQFAELDISTEADIEMFTSPIIHPGWPERAMGNHVVLGGRAHTDSLTTLAPNGATVTPGKRIQAERWLGGDNAWLRDVHAFAEIPEV